MYISLVIPLHNEAEGISQFHKDMLLPVLEKNYKDDYEIIYIDDGSNDRTLEIIKTLTKNQKNIKIVALSKNFGKEIATTAGIAYAKGKAVMILDGDGQHPPELIPSFVDKWEKGASVVVGVRDKNTNEGFVKHLGSKVFYFVINKFTKESVVPRSTDFRLIDTVVKDAFLDFKERHRITRGLIDWLGFSRDYINFTAPERVAGEAAYTHSKLFQLAMNSFVSLSVRPLFMFGWLGIIIVVFAASLGLFVILEQLILGDPLGLNVTGTAMLSILISFLIGVVLTAQGMLAVYISHIHSQTQGRPLFVVDTSNSVGITKR